MSVVVNGQSPEEGRRLQIFMQNVKKATHIEICIVEAKQICNTKSDMKSSTFFDDQTVLLELEAKKEENIPLFGQCAIVIMRKILFLYMVN